MILEFASVWVPPANFPTDPLVFTISVSVISLTENRIQRKSAASSMNRQLVNPLNERKSSVRGTIKGGNETWWLIGKSKAVPSLCKLDRMGNSGLQSFCSTLFTHLERQSEIHGQIDVKSYTDLLPLPNCFQLYIPTGSCHMEFISLNNYQCHTLHIFLCSLTLNIIMCVHYLMVTIVLIWGEMTWPYLTKINIVHFCLFCGTGH